MRLQDLYYRIGGQKGSFLQRKWSEYTMEKMKKKHRVLLQEKGIYALDAMKKACEEAGSVFGVEFGTLLGAYREHGFIRYDDDIDLSMWVEDCTRDFENLLLKYGFFKKRAFYLVSVEPNGNVSKKLTEIALDFQGLQVDLFFNFRRPDNMRSIYVYCYPIKDGKMTVKEYVLPMDTQWHDVVIKGFQYPTMGIPQQILPLVYGEDYMIPRKFANATKSVNPNVVIYEQSKCYGEGYVLY